MGDARDFTIPHQLRFGKDNLPYPGGMYITPDDVLGVMLQTSVAGLEVRVALRILDPSGHIQSYDQHFTPTSDREPNQFTLLLTEGWLLSVNVFTLGGAQTPGNCFAAVSLQRGLGAQANVSFDAPLCMGYVGINRVLGWPYGPMRWPEGGPGKLTVVTIANPAAGANFSITVPTRARWRVEKLVFQFNTSAVVNTRVVSLIHQRGAVSSTFTAANGNQVASNSKIYSCFPGMFTMSTSSVMIGVAVPVPLLLYSQDVLSSSTQNLDAGDQFSNIAIWVEEWMTQ